MTDKLVAVLRAALSQALDDQFRKHIQAQSFDAQELHQFFSSLAHESDRALAIVTFSYIDEKLQELMARSLNPHASPQRLFKFGPLSSASARIAMAAGLYWISPSVQRNLDAMREIRNRFAHRPFVTTFDDTAVAKLMDSMWRIEDLVWPLLEQEGIPRDSVTPRVVYHFRALITCQEMILELLTAPIAVRMGQEPFRAVHHKEEWDFPPLADVTTATAETMAMLIRQVAKASGGGAPN